MKKYILKLIDNDIKDLKFMIDCSEKALINPQYKQHAEYWTKRIAMLKNKIQLAEKRKDKFLTKNI